MAHFTQQKRLLFYRDPPMYHSALFFFITGIALLICVLLVVTLIPYRHKNSIGKADMVWAMVPLVMLFVLWVPLARLFI
jgi:hypothetical protein